MKILKRSILVYVAMSLQMSMANMLNAIICRTPI